MVIDSGVERQGLVVREVKGAYTHDKQFTSYSGVTVGQQYSRRSKLFAIADSAL